MSNKPFKILFISSKSVFRISLLVVLLTIAGVFLLGLGRHSTFFENSILSTTILSVAFFVFTTANLYRGAKLKEDVGAMQADQAPFGVALDLTIQPHHHTHSSPAPDVGDGLAGIVLGILLWIVWGFVVAVALWLFANVFMVIIAAFAAMLYWIFFRAMRLVFKMSPRTKGSIWASVQYGLMYTFLYNFWIYGIFVLVQYLKS